MSPNKLELLLLFLARGELKTLLFIDGLDAWGEVMILSEFLDDMADETFCMLCAIKTCYVEFFDLIKITEL